MGAAAFVFPDLVLAEDTDEKYQKMKEYLSSEEGYWLHSDIWKMQDKAFGDAGIRVPAQKRPKKKGCMIADFTGYPSKRLKTEAKYFLLHSLKEKNITAVSVNHNYTWAFCNLWRYLPDGIDSFRDVEDGWFDSRLSELAETERARLRSVGSQICTLIRDIYDETAETEKDVWHALKIPGARLSAAMKRQNPSISFGEIPEFYRPMIKRFMKRLVIKRSWSYCRELLMYIRYFFRSFYVHGYQDGFLEDLGRRDMEEYFCWVAADYADKNATFRSKAVSFIRTFLDYVQLSEYPGVPKRDIDRLIFDDDIPKRERPEDTMAKIRYIPKPVRDQIDAAVSEIDPPEMIPVYILLRETGWRGTDILDLRYDSCLDYVWNEKEQGYVPYLCGEITKTGIPMLKIPLREEVGGMVRELIKTAREKSTEENNPDRYLFNTYEGRSKGLPYSKPAFTGAIQELINRKGICDADGAVYHFKAHSLRHTRANEYTEQGMPIGVIQQMLGHCSLQMTLHYAKVSENKLYEKWKETEKLGLLNIQAKKPGEKHGKEKQAVDYKKVRAGLDAVKVPFGTCFKPSKLGCKQQINHCLECGSFCSCDENIPEYEAEIERIREKIRLGGEIGRNDWVIKNQEYLEVLKKMVCRIRDEKIVHKNGAAREDGNV